MTPSENFVVHNIDMGRIHYDDVFNVRGPIPLHKVMELAQSIKKRGLDSPIVCRPWDKVPGKDLHLVAGHRRFKAHQINEATHIPGFIRPMSDLDAHKLNLEENLQREDLDIRQEAKGLVPFLTLVGVSGGRIFTDAQVADIFSKSPTWVNTRVNLLKLPEDVQDLAASGIISQDQIKILAKMKDTAKMYELVRQIKEQKQQAEILKPKKTIKSEAEAIKKRQRTRAEMIEIGGMTYDIMGASLTTRFIAWAAGEISMISYFDSMREECDKKGIPFQMPDFIRKALLNSQG